MSGNEAPGRTTDDSSRRRFLGAVGVGSLGSLLAGCGESGDDPGGEGSPDDRAPVGGGQSDPFGDFDVIDGHVHLTARNAYGRETLDADGMIDWMDRYGIDQTVVLPLVSPTSFEVLSPTWWTNEQCAQYPDRLIPWGVVDPRIVVWGRDLLENRIETWVREGVRGFGEYKVNLPVDDSLMRNVYGICGQFDLPMVVHMDDVRATDEIGLPGLESMLQAYPNVDFIMHGPGWWANIDGDASQSEMGSYPSRPVGAPGAVERLLTDYGNVYASIDSGSGWNGLSRDVDYAQSLLEDHHEQIIFGTDKIYEGQDIGQFNLLDTFDLPDAAWRNIFSENLSDLMLPA